MKQSQLDIANKLVKLIKENHDLDVMCFVNEDVCNVQELAGAGIGSIRDVCIEEIYEDKYGDNLTYAKSETDVDELADEIEEVLNLPFDFQSYSDEEQDKFFDKLPWRKAIIVYIEV